MGMSCVHIVQNYARIRLYKRPCAARNTHHASSNCAHPISVARNERTSTRTNDSVRACAMRHAPAVPLSASPLRASRKRSWHRNPGSMARSRGSNGSPHAIFHY